jgi:hypothetical protein
MGTCQTVARTSVAKSLLEANGASGAYRNRDRLASEFHDDLWGIHQQASATTFNIREPNWEEPLTGVTKRTGVSSGE